MLKEITQLHLYMNTIKIHQKLPNSAKV